MEPLTPREVEILRFLEKGLSNREIALKLSLSLETVKWYNKNTYRKLGVKNRTRAAARARELGLLDQEVRESATDTNRFRSSLPLTLSSFVGRKREVAEVAELLRDARLVTLTGSGGTGKTRLSLRVAESVSRDYADGVVFVSLAATSDPLLVANAIAQKLRVVEGPGQPLARSLQRSLANKQLLLILDNFEHVLDAAPIILDLLGAATGLTVLVTSREALRLRGEHEYLVSPLPVPDTKDVSTLAEATKFESVVLFSQRAQMASTSFDLTDENFEVVAKICMRLDGLPLAIELAAARTKIFSLEQLLQRLDSRLPLLTGGPRDLPDRQRTLRDTIAWSYNLLDEGEKQLFARLAVFTGGRSLQAIEIVCGPGLDIDVIDGIESLLNKNLLYQDDGPRGEPRFKMLETIGEYARERLRDNGEEQLVRDRHLDYFRDLIEEMGQGYRQHGQLLLLERTELEMSNLRSAFNWAFESENIESAARLISSLAYFFYYTDRPVEGYQWYRRVLTKADDISGEVRIKLLYGAGRLAWVNGDLSQSRRYREEALRISRESGDNRAEGWSLMHLAISYIDSPEKYETAIKQSQEALSILREVDDKPGIAQALNILGELSRAVGDYSQARQAYKECLAICKMTGEIIRENMSYHNLGFVAYQEGQFEEARELIIKAMLKQQETGFIQQAISCVGSLSGPLSGLGQPEKAAQLLGATASLMAELGVSYHPSDQHEIGKYELVTKAKLGQQTYEALFAEGQKMTLDEAIAYALSE